MSNRIIPTGNKAIINIEAEAENIKKLFEGKKISAHVLWIRFEGTNDITVESVGHFDMQSTVVFDGFRYFAQLVEEYSANDRICAWTFSEITEPGCNLAIFRVVFNGRCSYQLNFVEID